MATGRGLGVPAALVNAGIVMVTASQRSSPDLREVEPQEAQDHLAKHAILRDLCQMGRWSCSRTRQVFQLCSGAPCGDGFPLRDTLYTVRLKVVI